MPPMHRCLSVPAAATALALAWTGPAPAQTEVPDKPMLHQVIGVFATLVTEDRVAEAVALLSPEAAPDAAAMEAWTAQLAAIETLQVLADEPAGWRGFCLKHKVTFAVTMDPASATAPMPFYGWDSSPAIRWVLVCHEEAGWQIAQIATGP
jgi:hypothetical protein